MALFIHNYFGGLVMPIILDFVLCFLALLVLGAFVMTFVEKPDKKDDE